MWKAITGVFLAALLVLLTACGGVSKNSATASLSTATPIMLSVQEYHDLFNGKTLGIIYQSQSEDTIEQAIIGYFKKLNIDFKMNVVYADSLTDGLLMLRSGKIAALQVMRFTGNYLTQRNTDLIMYINNNLVYDTCMIFSLAKSPELEKVNLVIQSMRKDGTLQELSSRWIDDLPVGEEPSGEKLPVIQDAETLKVGISGDAPPLDYNAADGTAGGFNVAVLSEISRRAGINIDLVTVSSNARFTALQSGKIDSFLWQTSAPSSLAATASGQETTPKAGLFFKSETYLESSGCILTLK